MAAVTKLAVRAVFADETKTTITINNLHRDNLAPAQIRRKVMDFNDAKGGSLTTKLKSKNGYNWIGIDKVTITTTDRTYIF